MPISRTEFLEPRRLLSGSPAAQAVAAPATTQVAGRYVFYNRSAFDDRGATADPRDDGAVAPDKAALLPGESISAANVTSYTRGINGVMIDVAGLAVETSLSADDFAFRVGNNGQPSSWTVAPAPKRVSVRPSPVAADVARITITWRDRAIRNTWVQVTVHANADTGLRVPDVFYFGNLIAEADEVIAAGVAKVDDGDLPLIGAAPAGPAPLDHAADVDRNGRITRADTRAAARNFGAELYAGDSFATDAGPAVDPPSPPGEWRLIFRDEFAEADLDSIWHPAQYWDHDLTVVGGDELQAYDPTGLSLDNGSLQLTARRDARHGVPYVSGLVMTGGEKFLPASPRFSFRYGYLEVRAKLPADKGLWPAVWLMPASYRDGNGELDVVELFGDGSRPAFTTHRRGRDDAHEWDAPDLSQDFHTFAIDWQPDHIAWYVDGVERARTTRPSLICREAMYPILNLAVGGAAGSPDETTGFPATMEVDYVRVWQTS